MTTLIFAMPRTKKSVSKNKLERKRNKSKKHKVLKRTAKKKKQDSIPINDMEQNFVFPVFDESQEYKNTKIQEYKNKHKDNLSPHVLDLRQPIKSEPIFEKPLIPPGFNPDDWFSNFIERQYRQPLPKRKTDFELPEHPEPPIKKIEYHKPPKQKIKSRVKLNFGQDIVQASKLRAKTEPSFQKFVGQRITKKFFLIIGQVITFPFKALDFLVDRSLKIVWWLIKFIILSLIKLAKSIFFNFKTILVTPKLARIEVTTEPPLSKSRINYKSILYFTLICLVIVLPLQILNLKQKSSTIKGQVLGRSMLGFESLKNASLLGQDLDFQQAHEEFQKAYFNFTLAHNYLDNLDILSQQIIKLIPETNQANNLLIIGQLAAELGQDFTYFIQELQEISQEEDEEVRLMKKVETTILTLNQIKPYFLDLLERVREIDIKTLAKYIDEKNLEKLILFQSSLPTLKQNFDQLKTLNQFLADFLGQEKTQKYLVIFQNNSELRPTGGFMGSYALVEIKKGKIINLEVPGGGFYDLKAASQVTVEAPKPFHLFSPTWQIWNANWFPHWPASAKKIAWFYESSLAGITLDGVVALTPDVIEDLLKITGPIEMLDYEKIITEENFVREVQMATEVEYDKEENQPKKIIADLLPFVLEKLFNLKTEQTPQFLQLLNNNLSKKNILFWFKDNEMQKVVEDFSWSGEIKPSQGDYLMVIHTNIGGGKTDQVIKNKILHNVEIDERGNVFDTLILTRKHYGNPEDIFENQNNVDYVRFYVPFNSQLIAAAGFDQIPDNLFKVAVDQKGLTRDPDLEQIEKNPILDERFNMRITQEFNKTCFGNWLMVKPGEEKTVTLKYQLPFKLEKPNDGLLDKLMDFIQPDNQEAIRYNLIVQKQPGLESTDFTSQLSLPSDWQVINMSQAKNKLEKDNNIIIYYDNLETDGYYSVEMR